jgi:hypothetical protein
MFFNRKPQSSHWSSNISNIDLLLGEVDHYSVSDGYEVGGCKTSEAVVGNKMHKN